MSNVVPYEVALQVSNVVRCLPRCVMCGNAPTPLSDPYYCPKCLNRVAVAWRKSLIQDMIFALGSRARDLS